MAWTLIADTSQEFEDVVGPENICDDPAIMPAYKDNPFAALFCPKTPPKLRLL